jgi:hypothetical protein
MAPWSPKPSSSVNYAPMAMDKEIIELFAVKNKFLDDLPLEQGQSLP